MNEDIHFVEVNAATIYETIITALEKEVKEPLYPGDERRIYGEAIVAVFVSLFNTMDDAARQKMLRYARGTVLDALGERSNTSRLEAEKAQTVIRFNLSNPIDSNIIIPKWTKITPDGERYFATDEIAVLQAGAYSVDVPTSAVSGGAEYNGYAAGTITTLVDLIPFVSSVTNTVQSSGGDDGEPYTTAGDDRYRGRIRLSASKSSTAGPDVAYIYWAMTADPNICDVKATSPEPGRVKIIPLLYGGKIPDADTIAKVLEVVDDSGIRPLTDRVSVEAPTQVPYGINITYYTTEAEEAAVIANVEGSGGAIAKYNEWQVGALGRAINPDYLRKLILSPSWSENLTGATRVDVAAPSFLEVADTAVAMWDGSLTVTHKVVREV